MFHSWFVVKLQKTTIVLLLYEALFCIQHMHSYRFTLDPIHAGTPLLTWINLNLNMYN